MARNCQRRTSNRSLLSRNHDGIIILIVFHKLQFNYTNLHNNLPHADMIHLCYGNFTLYIQYTCTNGLTHYLSKLILWWCCPPALPRPPGCFRCLPEGRERSMNVWRGVHCEQRQDKDIYSFGSVSVTSLMRPPET